MATPTRGEQRRTPTGPARLTPTPAETPRVVVALHEGFHGTTSGSGFSNRAFLTALTRLLPPDRLSVITPDEPNMAHDRRWTAEVQRMMRQSGAEVVTLQEHRTDPDSLHGAIRLSASASEAAARIAARADRCLLVGLDTPLLGLEAPPGADLLLVPRSTAALAHPEDITRVRWERAALRAATSRGGKIGAISAAMRGHLVSRYEVPPAAVVGLPNGLIRRELTRPRELPPLPFRARPGFLLAMGRAVPTKGFDDLLDALHLLKERGVRTPHLLLAAVTSEARRGLTPYQEDLASRIDAYGLDATLLTRFSPAIRAWLHSPALRAVVVPSREEPFGRIPLEAFAAGAAPVVATAAGGLAQTVVEGETGFTAAPRNPRSLAVALHRALTVLPRERERLRATGAALVRSRYDYEKGIASLLAKLAPWALAPSEVRR
ncbi:glycosyltransferase family 4 protein [Streptomyces sp. NPDC004959]|uniref:glycosyltransferase family 4 protein n=1 Tax=Streptomyces sp. NPDC004959 TaxID=3154673 RepID=UPI0033BB639D